MSGLSPIEKYDKLISSTTTDLNQQKSKANLWSTVRLFSFILFVSIIILSINTHWFLALVSGYVLALLFFKIIKKHNRITDRYQHLTRQLEICKQESHAVTNHCGYKYNGEKYKDDQHTYASDLDIFGQQSLYEFFNRCQTSLGETRLAEKFLSKSEQDTIYPYHCAIEELSKKTDWLTAFISILEPHKITAFNQQSLDDWKKLKLDWLGSTLLKWMSFIMPIVTILAFTLITIKFSLLLALITLIPNALLLRKYKERIQEAQDASEQSLKVLSGYKPLFSVIEQSNFTAHLLNAIKEKLSLNNQNASKALHELSWYIEQLEVKQNMLVGALFNIVTLWDFHFMRCLYRWKKEHDIHIDNWIDSISEMETLVSFSVIKHNNPGWCFPIFTRDDQPIKAKAVGHPLLHPDKRIDNDFNMKSKYQLQLITGSNMAGKSTFLRSVGTNMVLANAGAACCAASFELPVMDLYSSMRSNDALKDSTSGFYAELKKLKRIIDAVDYKRHCFYLIDEVLKGTNTHDRHIGSKALIKQLIKQPSCGLISTHDLELA